jgi:hypothetical protein
MASGVFAEMAGDLHQLHRRNGLTLPGRFFRMRLLPMPHMPSSMR